MCQCQSPLLLFSSHEVISVPPNRLTSFPHQSLCHHLSLHCLEQNCPCLSIAGSFSSFHLQLHCLFHPKALPYDTDAPDFLSLGSISPLYLPQSVIALIDCVFFSICTTTRKPKTSSIRG